MLVSRANDVSPCVSEQNLRPWQYEVVCVDATCFVLSINSCVQAAASSQGIINLLLVHYSSYS